MAFLIRLVAGIFALLIADVSPAQAQLEGHLYREQSRPEVYLVEGGRRIKIPTPDTLFAMGYSWNNVEVVADGTLQPLSRFDIPSTSPTPGALYYPPDGRKLQVLRAAPGAVTIHSRGKEVQLVELQGWLRGVNPDCGDGWDVHYALELDTEWAEQQGIDIQAILRVGNIVIQGIRLPGMSARRAVSLPMIDVEFDAYGRGERGPPGLSKPADWKFVRLCDDGHRLTFPFDPFRADGAVDLPAAEPTFGSTGPYVRISGSLVTDSPHDVQTRPGTFLSRWLAITVNDEAEWGGVVPSWHPGVDENDGRHYARWTEVHPPDKIEVLQPKTPKYTLRGVALAARVGALPFVMQACEELEFDLGPEWPAPSPTGFQVAWQEMRGPETYWPWGENADNGSWITNAGNHIHVRAKVCGGALGGSPGRFKALYRVWWEPIAATPPVTPTPTCARDCASDRDECFHEVRSPGGPRSQVCVQQYNICLRACR